MPLPWMAIAQGGVGLANSIMEGINNKKARDYATQMYNVQRKDALADVAFQNQYNSPAAQMERLKAGGLNPNLVYGQGATTVSAQTRSSSPQNPNTKAPQLDIGSAMTITPQLEMMKLQNENLTKQGALIDAQRTKVEAETPNIIQKTNRSIYDLDFLKTIEQNRIEKSYQEGQMGGNRNRQIQASTAFTNDENLRQAAMQKPNLKAAIIDVLEKEYRYGQMLPLEKKRLEGTIQNIKNSNQIQRYEIFMNNKGITKGSSDWLKMMRTLIYNAKNGEDSTATQEFLEK